jgi:hypothetical protein
MIKKIFANSFMIIISMIILLSLMPLHGSLTEIEEGKRQQHFAYATTTTTTTSSSSSIPTTNFNFAAVGYWACNPNTTYTVKQIQNKEPELVLALGDRQIQILIGL